MRAPSDGVVFIQCQSVRNVDYLDSCFFCLSSSDVLEGTGLFPMVTKYVSAALSFVTEPSTISKTLHIVAASD